ncbi:MAG: indolepyruvate ferredoxin oxidoreductase subunit alpha [Chloroflexota bacterium]|nr:indolepyruvate ferredoxin oxidoreductase subunit alpha [Chloroflexota bacterium]
MKGRPSVSSTGESSSSVLLSGNEAIAQGAREAGVGVATGYPGTPSTEILEALVRSDPDRDVYVEWSSNEKVAIDVALGAAIGGTRALVTMKHVGLNVASDTFMTAAYTGVRAGLVVVSADDPGMHSSQNEQDNRFVARFAGVPLLEPSDSAEARDLTVAAFEIAERFDTPVLLRTTTRIAHARALVSVRPARRPDRGGFRRDRPKYVMLPGFARQRRIVLLDRLAALAEYAETSPLQRVELGDLSVGVITSSIAYQYVREALPEASVLKLGLTHPLPARLIRDFCSRVERVLVVEELDPYLEDQIRALGIAVEGKRFFARAGELGPDSVRAGLRLAGAVAETAAPAAQQSPPTTPRPPLLCPGCPHVVPFLALRQLGAVVTGDIGCYTLAASAPLEAMDSCVAMGSSIGMAIGVRRSGGASAPVVAAIGDSTFMHAGIPALVDAVTNGTDLTVLILDNGTTAMTGGQAQPGTGSTIRGDPSTRIDLAALCLALGARSAEVVDPYDVAATHRALEKAVASSGVSVVITDRPCVEAPVKVRDTPFAVVAERCIACQLCMNLGCPSIVWDGGLYEGRRRVRIDASTCTGCAVCAQLCPTEAMVPLTGTAAGDGR